MNRIAAPLSFAFVLVAALSMPSYADAQEGGPFAQYGQRTPRFLYAANTNVEPVDIDPRTAPVLRDRISVAFDDVSLRDALKIISSESGLRIFYSKDVVALDTRVRLRAEDITVAAALTEVLLDAGVDVLLGPNGKAALVERRGVAHPEVQQGTIVGRVTEVETGNPVVNAQIAVDGRGRTLTDRDGQYRIEGVEPGLRTVRVESIGYREASREVEVGDGATVAVDFELAVQPSQLAEVVVTATGEQRRMELGHVVGVINADSLVREAPISNLSELLTARVPGLQVNTNSGQVGGSVSLRIRTLNSINLVDAEPIIIVDGVRYTSGALSGNGPFRGERTSRLNDLNPNDIESVEVVNGPAASTIYGTDAADGVIVITTKRGRSGPTQWNAYVRGGFAEIPAGGFPEGWWGWSTAANGEPATTSCDLAQVAQGACVQDSVTVLPNLLNDPERTIFASKPAWEYGANVSGGQQDFTYYVSGAFSQATGPIRMPPGAVEEVKEERGVAELPEEQLEPNSMTKVNLRARISAKLGATADLYLTTEYTRADIRTIDFENIATGWGLGTPNNPYGFADGAPEQRFSLTQTDGTDRFLASLGGRWQPRSWLEVRGTFGADLASRKLYSLARAGEAEASSAGRNGRAGDMRTRHQAITGDVGLTLSSRRGPIGFRTAVGGQLARSHYDNLNVTGRGLTVGAVTVGQAATPQVESGYLATVTVGTYIEQMISFNDRLFVTGAVRVDGASGFGEDYNVATYPKASVSWVVSEEPFLARFPLPDELRLRYAFGMSGKQPPLQWARSRFQMYSTAVDGQQTSVVSLSGLGSPNLRPERVREHEFGLDVSALDGRLGVGLTWFRRATKDQIVRLPLPAGFGDHYTNLSRLEGRGFEAKITATPIRTDHLTWDVSFLHSFRRTRVVDLGTIDPAYSRNGGYVEGYPLGARFTPVVENFEDTNGDGIISSSEVELSDPVYKGETMPPRSQTLGSVLGLLDGRIRISVLLDRHTGFTRHNYWKALQCPFLFFFGQCRAAVDPTTPLAEQADVAARIQPIEPGDFTRLREVTASFQLPDALLKRLGIRSARLSASARNVALWTDFAGGDPESGSMGAFPYSFNSDGAPQSRSWTLRLDLGF